jgi:outer membrane biosynthesis protein TonB
MERQAGLGRSLEDVLDSLAPVEADPGAPGRVLFEPRDLERQVDQLAAEIGDVRERVQRLVGQVSDADAAVANGTTNGTHEETADAEGGAEPAAAPMAETPGPPEELEVEPRAAELHEDEKKKDRKKKDKKKKAKQREKAKRKKKKKKQKKAKQKSAAG